MYCFLHPLNVCWLILIVPARKGASLGSGKETTPMKRVWMIIAMQALVAAFSDSAPAQAATVDHFRCYLVPAATTMNVSARLQDQFDAATGSFENITTLTIEHFCNPVEKIVNGVVFPIINPAHHLTMFHINPQTTIARTVVVNNQFGTQTLSVADARWLAVPTGKSLPPNPPPPPSTDLDHYKCYAASGPTLVNTVATLKDQFRSDTVNVLQPVRFCNPVEKIRNGVVTPIQHPTVHLVCYATSVINFQTRINIRNQFISLLSNLLVENPDLLCAPSSKLSWQVVTGTN